MPSPLSIIMKSINTKTEILDQAFIEAEYVPFVVNRSLSYIIDVVLFTHEMSLRSSSMPVWDQYLWYYHIIPKKKRFSRWHKYETPKYLQAVKEYYNYSTAKAMTALSILTDDQCAEIVDLIDKGGIVKCKMIKSLMATESG